MKRWVGWETVGVTFSQSEFIEGQLYGYSRTRPFCKREEKLCMGEEVNRGGKRGKDPSPKVFTSKTSSLHSWSGKEKLISNLYGSNTQNLKERGSHFPLRRANADFYRVCEMEQR